MKRNKNFTNVIVIDASSSMSDKEESVRNGLQELFKDIKKKAKDDPTVTFKTIVVKFSNHDKIETLVNATGTAGLTKKLADSYTTDGMTALYDAIGYAFGLVPTDETAVFVNILTDGEENNSKVFDQNKLKSLISESKSRGWGITFMGASEEAITSATNLGISRGNTVRFANSGGGTIKMSAARNKMSSTYYVAAMDANSNIDINNMTSELDDDLKDGK